MVGPNSGSSNRSATGSRSSSSGTLRRRVDKRTAVLENDKRRRLSSLTADTHFLDERFKLKADPMPTGGGLKSGLPIERPADLREYLYSGISSEFEGIIFVSVDIIVFLVYKLNQYFSAI